MDLNEEQSMLQRTAREFVAGTCPPEVAKEWDEEAHDPTDLIRGMADLGWFELPFLSEFGEPERAAVELTIIAEELGMASFDIAMLYIASVIASSSIARFASPELRADMLEALKSGEKRMAIAISEPSAGSDVSAIETRATDVGGEFVLNGQKLWCTGAGLSNTWILLYARTEGERGSRDGLTAVVVDPKSEGVELRQIPTLARHVLGTYEVFLTDVRVSKKNQVGPLNRGWSVLLSGLELERVLISGGYVGAAQATINEAVSYGMEREQFGQPVATFQALAHQLADLQTRVDASRLLTYRAGTRLAKGSRSVREGSMAKLFGSETYVDAARWLMQVCGGFGFSTESMASFRYREAIVATISGGTSQIQRNIIARSMGIRGG